MLPNGPLQIRLLGQCNATADCPQIDKIQIGGLLLLLLLLLLLRWSVADGQRMQMQVQVQA